MSLGAFLKTYAPGLVAAGLSTAFATYMIYTGGNGGADAGLPTVFVRHAPVERVVSRPPAHPVVPGNRLLPDAPLVADELITGTVGRVPHETEDRDTRPDAERKGRQHVERRPGEEPLPKYVLRFASPAMALVEGAGRLWNVEPGDELPGLGRVIAIERKGGRWIVRASDGSREYEISGE
jgi:hypothetical protein